MPSVPEKLNLPVFSTAKSWREREGRYRLQGITCKDCGKKIFPKGEVCPYCHSRNVELTEFKQTGKIVTDPQRTEYSMTSFQSLLPIHIAMVEIDDGPCVMAELVHDPSPADRRPGTRVKMVLRKLRREESGNYLYGFKFQIIA